MVNLIMQTASSNGMLMQILPLILIFVIFYFLLIRPQNQRMKQHRKMQEEIKRGDVIVTNGGLVGKVIKADGDELMIDLGENIKVKALRTMIADVRNRPEPANDRADKKK